nr:MAG TPA: tail collar fiber protein [Caudoviricetes sp.]
MAVFKDTTITDNGRTLIADALANNRQITFTRIITSSKSYEDSTDASKLTSVDEIKQSVNITRINQEGTKVRLNAIFTNSAVNTSYKIQTIGLYAKIGTGNEILYSVTRAKEPDTMPATNGINLATVEIDLITEINNSNGATMLINPSTLVTTSSLVAELEKLTGLEFGGNIQDTGNKVKGKFYFDNVTKFYYECIADTNLTYNESSKFRAISNKPISDRLENLFEVESQRVQVANGDVIFTRKGKTVTVMVRLQNDGNNITFQENQQLLEIPTKFRPALQSYGFEAALASSSLTPGLNGATRMQINPTNITIWGAHLGRFNVLKGSATYFID